MEDYSSEKILKAKNRLDKQLIYFLNEYPKINRDTKHIQNLITELISEHSNILSTINIAIGKSHQETDFFISNDLQLDYLKTLQNFLPTSFQIIDLIRSIIKKHKLISFNINGCSYETIQRFINTFADSKTSDEIKQEFIKREISVTGFNRKFKRMKEKYIRLQLVVGIPILILCSFLIFSGEYFLKRSFNGIQLIFLKALISLSVSIIGSSLIEGNIQTNWTIQKGLTIRAIGWVGIFLLIYFLNPASPGAVY